MTDHTLTFGQFLEEFRQDYGGWSENTWRGNSGLLKRLREEFGEDLLTDITPRQIDGYLSLAGKRVSPKPR